MPENTPEKQEDLKDPPMIPVIPLSCFGPKKAKDQSPVSSATSSPGQPSATQAPSDAEPASGSPPSTSSKPATGSWDDSPPPDSPSQFLERYSPRKLKAQDPTAGPSTPTKQNKTPESKKTNTPSEKEFKTPEDQKIPEGEVVTPTAPFTEERRKGVRLADGRVVGEDDSSPPEKKGDKEKGETMMRGYGEGEDLEKREKQKQDDGIEERAQAVADGKKTPEKKKLDIWVPLTPAPQALEYHDPVAPPPPYTAESTKGLKATGVRVAGGVDGSSSEEKDSKGVYDEGENLEKKEK